ncbi:hypothetical protein KY284_010741 [Solanum tuberosum]|nr:hypothetical protein KY284_010741 [Solanum tuberosum]
MRNLKKEKSWRLIGRTKTKGNKANKIPETCKCNTQIERMETPVHNTSSTKKKEITTSQLMKNGILRRGKLACQFNIAWTDQNLLRKHCSSNRLITQDQPNNQEGAEYHNSKNKDTMEKQINNKSTTDNMLGMRTLTLTIV